MYFKILSNDLTHYGYTYHEGLNEDPEPFEPYTTYIGGLFFSNEEDILEFCGRGDKIAEVTLPEGETVIEWKHNHKAHRIVLGKIRDLWTVETFQWLKECGMNLHVGYEWPLRKAAEKGCLDVVKYLVEHGADIHALKNAAFMNAALEGHLDIVKYLVLKGVDIHVPNDGALIWSACAGHLEIVKYLVEQGANVHTKNNYALREMAADGHLEIVKCLVEHGADIHAMDDDALCRAATGNHLEVVKYLVEQGADLNAVDPVIYWVKRNNHQDVLEYFKDECLRHAGKYARLEKRLMTPN